MTMQWKNFFVSKVQPRKNATFLQNIFTGKVELEVVP